MGKAQSYMACHWAGTRSLLFPKCLDTSRVSGCAGLVKADGGAEPTCKIHFLGIRPLDKSMNLHVRKEEVMLKKNTKKENSRVLVGLELVPGACP